MSMSTASTVHWIERSPDLHEARATLPDSHDVYVGYVAVSPGDSMWRGYASLGFTPAGMGPCVVTQWVYAHWSDERAKTALQGRHRKE